MPEYIYTCPRSDCDTDSWHRTARIADFIREPKQACPECGEETRPDIQPITGTVKGGTPTFHNRGK